MPKRVDVDMVVDSRCFLGVAVWGVVSTARSAGGRGVCWRLFEVGFPPTKDPFKKAADRQWSKTTQLI